MSTRKSEAELRSGVIDSSTIVSTWRSGNRGTRIDTIPRNNVTVWVGTSWENATRNEICNGIVPLTDVKLLFDQ